MEVSTSSLLNLGSFLFWCALYMWCSVRSPEQSPEWCSRVVTLLHGSVAALVGLGQCELTNLCKSRFTAKVLPQQYGLMVWSWGYFAFDLLWCLIYWPNNPLMLVHHGAALTAITVYMHKDFTGCVFACTMAMMEITNPLLQIRWFLRSEGYEKSMLFVIVEAVYLLLFVGLRGPLGTYIMYQILSSDIFDKEEKVISLIFYFVSVAFIYEIGGYILHKYKNKIGEWHGFLLEAGYLVVKAPQS